MKSQTIRKYPENFICWMVLDFAIQTLGVFRQIVLQVALRVQRFQTRAAFFEPLPGDVLEIRVGGVRLGNGKLGKRFGDRVELDLAALGDVPGAVERFGNLAEQLQHLFARLEIELRLW